MSKIITIIVVALVAITGFIFISNGKLKAPASLTSGSPVVSLQNKSLTQIGSDIYNNVSATTLDLSGNSIKSLPSQIGKMVNLTSLKLDNNQLDSLPAEIRQMPKLKTLDASHNNLTAVPAEIGQLKDLENLDLSYNKITALPNEIANLRDNLKVLNLTGNPLSSDQISKLKTELPNTNIIF